MAIQTESSTFCANPSSAPYAAAAIREVVESGRSGLVGEFCEILSVEEE